MARTPNTSRPDPENPEWTEDDFRRARPAGEVLPELIGHRAAGQLLRPRGRPKTDRAKVAISLRVDREVLEHFKRGGPGWQTRINDTLKRAAHRTPRKPHPRTSRPRRPVSR